MQPQRLNEIHRINYLTSEMDSIYHQASPRLGISDSVSIILYTIQDKGESCLLSDVYKSSGVSRQTVNSAIRRLEADGVLYLEPYAGRAKKIVLTDKGRDYIRQTVARLLEAEIRAFDGWSEDEIKTHIGLMEKYTESLRRQIHQL